MAVTADLLLAVSVRPASADSNPTVRIGNVSSSKFAPRQFDVPAKGDIVIDAESHEWANYFKAGLKGAMTLLRHENDQSESFRPHGMDILVDGTVPSGGGLSSSAAFVCASALAVLKANEETVVDKKELVELAIVSERAVGVHSGGSVIQSAV